MKTQKLLIIAAALTLTLSCEKTPEDLLTETTPTDGSQSASQLAGSGTYCSVESIMGGSFASSKSLTLNTDGTYTYYVHFSDSASCANSINTGGNNIATYYQAGVWTVAGTNTTPSTSTKLIFVVGSENMTVYADTDSDAQAIVTWANANCSPNPGYTNTINTKTLTGTVCSASGGFSAVTFNSASDQLTNIGYNPGSGTFSLGSSTGQTVWTPGGSTYPSSYTYSFYSW